MAIPQFADDFKEFLKLLNSNGVEYLLIGGYAVGIHGYVRATNDLDIWVRREPNNAQALDKALRAFGFASAFLSPDLFLTENSIVRMGVPPMRLENTHVDFWRRIRRMPPRKVHDHDRGNPRPGNQFGSTPG